MLTLDDDGKNSFQTQQEMRVRTGDDVNSSGKATGVLGFGWWWVSCVSYVA